ncbi:MAG: zinc-ribbon domain-containing protein [Nitrosomonadales bacterium]|nr:zinc-ribbon domain-containing protein [Nitrosomonadales bacterium]
MSGTTRCPYCITRFKITEAQLEAHAGMVRCGYCHQTFDARPGFVSDEPSPQLELPILDMPVAVPDPSLPVLQPMTLAEEVAVVEDTDADDGEHQPADRTWLWGTAATFSLLLFLAQAAYFFRVDLAAQLPAVKPALIGYCKLLKCTVPLPQHTELIGIESSGLETYPGRDGWIVLNALLRNRAAYAQAFPNLELTLSDSQDKPLARRVFRPTEYLSPLEYQSAGLQPNRELGIKLHLDTADLKPMGYRLALFYSNGQAR